MTADKIKSRPTGPTHRAKNAKSANPANPATPHRARSAVTENAGRSTGGGTEHQPRSTDGGAEYRKLQVEQEHTQAKLKRLRSYLEDEVERVIDGSEDSVDAASDVYEREKTLAIIQTLEKKLASVEHALQAAEKGGYGICEVCGNPIDPARLAAMPHSTTCIKCQEKLEHQQRRRPLAAFALRDEE